MGVHQITLTHLNIRQSIAILLAKLVLTDILLSIVVVGFYFALVQGGQLTEAASQSTILFITVFGLIGIIKIGLSIYIVLQWLYEYYEITPEYIIHKRGVIFRKSEKYGLDKVRGISMQDTFLGELFNFATLTLYDLRLNKYLDMYLIHNPDRYANVLQTLKPELEMKSDRIKLPFMPKSELIDDIEEKGVVLSNRLR